ncbi:hypothetical protein [Clostridium sp. 1xD42-85]|uniref:hypothetical protein n=1 Tax=Clostridium sp. 1xD42-85 TaxID=2320084 RepID=UPI001A9A99D4|nr:hypothetical protein [Clostridium sp. 1xD42-85]
MNDRAYTKEGQVGHGKQTISMVAEIRCCDYRIFGATSITYSGPKGREGQKRCPKTWKKIGMSYIRILGMKIK